MMQNSLLWKAKWRVSALVRALDVISIFITFQTTEVLKLWYKCTAFETTESFFPHLFNWICNVYVSELDRLQIAHSIER